MFLLQVPVPESILAKQPTPIQPTPPTVGSLIRNINNTSNAIANGSPTAPIQAAVTANDAFIVGRNATTTTAGTTTTGAFTGGFIRITSRLFGSQ